MARLFDFDYKSPFFYMVTLKRLDGLADFSKIGDDGCLVKSAITRAFEEVIESFHLKWRCIEPISPYVVMPDHIHLMVKIKDVLPRKSLAVLVWQLTRALSKEYWRVTSGHSRLPQNPEPRQSFRVLRGAHTETTRSSRFRCSCRLKATALPRKARRSGKPLSPRPRESGREAREFRPS